MPGKKLVYASLDELQKNLRARTGRCRKVAMQYSPRNAIPYISMVDAGTVELVRARGCQVVSSADLVQKFEASWSAEQYRFASRSRPRDRSRHPGSLCVRGRDRVKHKSPLTEYELQQWMLEQFRAGGVTTDEPPIVAVGPHSGDPHYEPRATGSSPIRTGDLLLLDVWGKLDRPGSVYYDITWVGYLGAEVPEKYAKIFAIVAAARDRAIAFVQQSLGRWARRPRLAGGSSRARGHSQSRVTPSISCIAPATTSGRTFTAMAPIWTVSRRTTSAASCRERAFRSSRASTCRSSACAAK